MLMIIYLKPYVMDMIFHQIGQYFKGLTANNGDGRMICFMTD